MDLLRRRLVAIPWIALAGCQRAEEPRVKTDLEMLGRLIRLPAPPQSAQWEVVAAGRPGGLGPDDWSLVAVLSFTPAQRAALLAAAAPAPGFGGAVSRDWVRPWLPAALRTGLVQRADGHYTLPSPALDPAPFLSPPLGSGFFVPFGDQGDIALFLGTA